MPKSVPAAPPLSAKTKAPPAAQQLKLSELSDSELVKHLGNAYESLNQVWEEAEADLRRFPIPYGTEIILDVDEAGNEDWLGFHKVRDNWHICYGVRNLCYEEEGGSVRPITECAVAIRMAMVEHFPKLRLQVREHAAQAVADVLAAASKLSLELI